MCQQVNLEKEEMSDKMSTIFNGENGLQVYHISKFYYMFKPCRHKIVTVI
jgi:hypothetical protein